MGVFRKVAKCDGGGVVVDVFKKQNVTSFMDGPLLLNWKCPGIQFEVKFLIVILILIVFGI